MKRLMLLIPAAFLFTSCTTEDRNYFFNGPSDGSYTPAYNSSSNNTQWQQQVRQAEFQQQSQAYKSGFTTTPPAGYSPY